MTWATGFAFLLAAAGQTTEGSVRDEVLAAYQATIDRGSFRIHLTMTMRQEIGEMKVNAESEGRGAWQVPGTSRIRQTVHTAVEGGAQNDLEQDLFTRDGRVWMRAGPDAPWQPMPEMSNQEFMRLSITDPVGAMRRVLELASDVTRGEPADVGGVRCRTYVVLLDGAGFRQLMGGDALAQTGVTLDEENSRMRTTVSFGEEDNLLRRTEGVGHIAMEAGGNGMTMDMDMTQDLSDFGAATAEIPADLPEDAPAPAPEPPR